MEAEQFSTEGGLTGGWPPLTERYAEWKDEQRPGMPILVFSGLLQRAATHPEVHIEDDHMTMTINDEGTYTVFSKAKGLIQKHKPATAGWHQKGAGTLPQRKVVIDIDDEIGRRWAKFFHDTIVFEDLHAPWGGYFGG
jgi:hypothetical protein